MKLMTLLLILVMMKIEQWQCKMSNDNNESNY